jgi:glyoxylase-like metal-dependent hydrolase (beta-lactamase superfamily II)
MVTVKFFTFGLFETNTYVVRDEQGNALLVDPACSNEYEKQVLARYVELENLSVRAIIATHGHLDHLWGAKWATEKWGLPVMVHKADIPIVEAMQQQYNMFGIRREAEAFAVEPLSLQPSAFSFQIIETPGHTPGSVCLYWPEEKMLLSGDTLFRMGYGRTDLPGGNMGQLIDSLDRLFALPVDILVYPGHGEITTIGQEARR